MDASECLPTFGVDDKFIGIIAGGDAAIRKAKEFAEDSKEQGWLDLKSHNVNLNDLVIGISASGSTPYVVSALKKCKRNGITTGSISCNLNAKISKYDLKYSELPFIFGKPDIIEFLDFKKKNRSIRLFLPRN